MPHNVESMMFAGERNKIWHGLGRSVAEAPNSAEALKLAGLDWDVERVPVSLLGASDEIPNYLANVRRGARMIDPATGEQMTLADGSPALHPDSVLGIMSESYTVVQNRDAFAFTDNLIGGDVRYDTAGSLRGGRTVWMLAKLPTEKILDDEVEPYLCFSNSHDGTSAIRVCCTPVRVVCNNTLNIALSGTRRSWTARHVGNLSSKMDEAKITLGFAHDYMAGLSAKAAELAAQGMSYAEYKDFLEEIFPMPKDADKPENKRKKDNTLYLWNLFNVCYQADDIKKFRGTKWGIVNALSDCVYHGAPLRETQNYRENLWGKSMDGNAILDRAMALL